MRYSVRERTLLAVHGSHRLKVPHMRGHQRSSVHVWDGPVRIQALQPSDFPQRAMPPLSDLPCRSGRLRLHRSLVPCSSPRAPGKTPGGFQARPSKRRSRIGEFWSTPQHPCEAPPPSGASKRSIRPQIRWQDRVRGGHQGNARRGIDKGSFHRQRPEHHSRPFGDKTYMCPRTLPARDAGRPSACMIATSRWCSWCVERMPFGARERLD